MRVISGERRGLKLMPPPDRNPARPTEDKTKESVFNIIQPIRQGAICLDLFAATGQIGIEFLSRGAAHAVFSEKSGQMARVLKANLEKAHYTDRADVLIGDFRSNIKRANRRFDYVYIDPPFKQGLEKTALEALLSGDALTRDALVIVESHVDTPVSCPSGYRCIFERSYRTQCIRIFKESGDENHLSGEL